MSENEGTQDGGPGFSFSDKRRIDPETGEVRPQEGAAQDADEAPAASEAAASGAEGAQPEQSPAGADASDLGVEIPDDASELDGEPAAGTGEELTGDAKRAAEALEDLQRLNAEYAAYRMRAGRDQERAREAGVVSVAEALIPVLDEVRLARENGDVTGPFEVHVTKLFEALEKLGVEQFGEVGEEFDPAHHEALMQQPSEEVDGPTVFMVMQPGYRLGERVIRAARVGVQQPAD
ncbi:MULTISPECIES: nucleotide exchange factor GrpE [Brevibacterium]|uniref:Protein GrpE n=1 Tax=Brevibacterium salitolerans TaxID=1403566 RepID=A0ABN2WIV4_9MICO|nr:nucleotide exchange factor GrpE [Brevibacterium sp.]